MRPDEERHGPPASTWRGTATAYALVALAPAAAWLTVVSWAAGTAGGVAHVAWFLVVAAASIMAGAVARPRAWQLGGLWVVAATATVATVYAWWASEADDGLFLIGVALATPCVLLVAPLLLLLGRRLAGR